jgi:tetratricopeptide (TPR) repeat protein
LKHAAALFVITFIAYLPALRAGWIWDDDYYVTKNANLRDASGLRNIWTRFGLRNGGTPQYYPVTHTTFWVEHQLWGTRPAGYHAVNILLHATNAILLWLILKRLEVPGAWIVACAVALHPVHVESVAWVTERKNTLSGLFYLSAAYVYLFYVAWASRPSEVLQEGSSGETPKPRARWYALALLLFICALLSKSVTASLPAAILLVTWWKRGRVAWRDIVPLVPMFVLGVAMGALTSWIERAHVGAQGFDWALSPWQRILIAGRAVWFYAMKLVLPIRLSFVYPRWDVDPARVWQWIFPLAAMALIVFMWAMRRRWGRGPLVAVLFFGGTLLPALGFVDVYPMRYSFVADHFQYLASIGLLALIVAAMATWLGPRMKIVAGVWLVGLAALTFSRTLVYHDLETLWRDTIAKNPTGWMPRNNLANMMIDQRKFDAAEELLGDALRHNPEQPEVLANLGVLAEKRGRPDQAMDLYRRSLARQESANALANVGSLHLQQGEFDAAERAFGRAVDVEPTSARAHRLLGVARASRQDFRGAAEAFRRAGSVPARRRSGFKL